jgi:uncharacterized protein (TIGR03083 family)
VLDVTSVLRPERAAFVELLSGLSAEQWSLPTECPAYDVKGVATHVLGDDLSLLSRQRDAAVNGLLLVAEELPGSDFRTLLDTFNDRWVHTARFFSPAIVVELLRLVGDWTADYYEAVDLDAPGEPVGFFRGHTGEAPASSPFWQAIAREYVERWVHHSQIRRALGLGSLCEDRFLEPGLAVVALARGLDWRVEGGHWFLGDDDLGEAPAAADSLTLAHPAASAGA